MTHAIGVCRVNVAVLLTEAGAHIAVQADPPGLPVYLGWTTCRPTHDYFADTVGEALLARGFGPQRVALIGDPEECTFDDWEACFGEGSMSLHDPDACLAFWFDGAPPQELPRIQGIRSTLFGSLLMTAAEELLVAA